MRAGSLPTEGPEEVEDLCTSSRSGLSLLRKPHFEALLRGNLDTIVSKQVRWLPVEPLSHKPRVHVCVPAFRKGVA